MAKHASKPENTQTVIYPDGSSLTRPFSFPKSRYIMLGLFVVLASGIGVYMLINMFDKVIFSAERQQATVKEIVSTQVDMGLPSLPVTLGQTNEQIQAWMDSEGFVTVDMTSLSSGGSASFDVTKLPQGVELLDAQLAYAQGLGSASADSLARLLHGSWRLTIDRNEPLSISLKYADFNSGTIDQAIRNAIAAEGLGGSELGESGVDEAGNTFQAGVFTNPETGTQYNWQISACLLSDVYSVDGLPSDAVYVGIRMTY